MLNNCDLNAQLEQENDPEEVVVMNCLEHILLLHVNHPAVDLVNNSH